MSQFATDIQVFEIIAERHLSDGVCFDAGSISLVGIYSDELSAHRARKGWIETLEGSFFLENKQDYQLRVTGDEELSRFVLTCAFESAAGRYAFWRLTHSQAPEAQYLIETAHLPVSGNYAEAVAAAPDISPLIDTPEKLDGEIEAQLLSPALSTESNNTVSARIISVVRSLLSRIPSRSGS